MKSPSNVSAGRSGRGARDFLEDNGLPVNIDAEKFILGSILLDDSGFASIAGSLQIDDFALQKHQCIFRRMREMYSRGEGIDRVTLANELLKRGELESVDGLSYLVSLDDGLPQIPHLDSYVRIIREKATLRRIATASEHITTRAILAEEPPAEILKSAGSILADIQTATSEAGLIDDLPAVCAQREPILYIREPELPEGALIALTGDSGSGKSTLATAWARDAIAAGRPVVVLDRENPHSVVVERMARLALTDGPLLRWAGGWNGEDAPGPDDEQVIRWVKSCKVKPLLIVDSLAGFIRGDENSATDMRRFMHFCRRLADAGACVVIIHHDGKADTAKDFRGSSDFKAAVDQAFHVTNKSADLRLDQMRLRCFKSRFGVFGSLQYLYDDGNVTRTGDNQPRQSTSNDRFRALLARNPRVTITGFEKLAKSEGLGRNDARTFLDAGVAKGLILRKTGAKNAQIHSLKDVSDEKA